VKEREREVPRNTRLKQSQLTSFSEKRSPLPYAVVLPPYAVALVCALPPYAVALVCALPPYAVSLVRTPTALVLVLPLHASVLAAHLQVLWPGPMRALLVHESAVLIVTSDSLE
jgi:hypothetical protein